MKEKILSIAIVSALGLPAVAMADIVELSFTGLQTLLNPDGTAADVNDDVGGAPYYGRRTPINGTLTFDTDNGSGSMTVAPFSWRGSGLATATNISLQTIGDGAGEAGELILGNMSYNWNNNVLPISTVWDASGLLNALNTGVAVSDSITGGALPATDGFAFNFGTAGTYALPIGPSPLAATTWNTTDIGTVGVDTNPSGTLPLTDDGIGGSPVSAGFAPGFNFNYDITTLKVEAITSTVPVPATAWLLGSGLLGFARIAKRRKTT